MDIDMLGKTSNEETDILPLVRDILAVTVDEDGMPLTLILYMQNPSPKIQIMKEYGFALEVRWILK